MLGNEFSWFKEQRETTLADGGEEAEDVMTDGGETADGAETDGEQ
jgi:cytochrome c oxidase subunit 1